MDLDSHRPYRDLLDYRLRVIAAGIVARLGTARYAFLPRRAAHRRGNLDARLSDPSAWSGDRNSARDSRRLLLGSSANGEPG